MIEKSTVRTRADASRVGAGNSAGANRTCGHPVGEFW